MDSIIQRKFCASYVLGKCSEDCIHGFDHSISSNKDECALSVAGYHCWSAHCNRLHTSVDKMEYEKMINLFDNLPYNKKKISLGKNIKILEDKYKHNAKVIENIKPQCIRLEFCETNTNILFQRDDFRPTWVKR